VLGAVVAGVVRRLAELRARLEFVVFFLAMVSGACKK
jgi:hypothetical protein